MTAPPRRRRIRAAGRRIRAAAGLGGPAAEVGLDDPGVRCDVAGPAFGDLLAVVHHCDALGNAHHHPHVMLDEQDRYAQLVSQAADEARRLLGLGGVHPRGRLVEEEKPRLGGQGACDFHPPLGAVGQAPRELVADSLEADVLHQVFRPRLGPLLLGLEGPGPEHGLHRVLPESRVRADHDVLHDGHAPEKPDVLEGPRHVEVHDPVRRQAVDAPALEPDLPLLGPGEPRKRVEECRLARTVGPDDGVDAALLHREAQPVDRGEAAESLHDVFRLEDQAGLTHDRPPSHPPRLRDHRASSIASSPLSSRLRRAAGRMPAGL